MNYLISRADDCGIFRQANEAIYVAVTQGWARNVGFMAPAPYFREAVEMLRPVKNICRGLHVTMNSEWLKQRCGPLTPGMVRYCDAPDQFAGDTVSMFHKGIIMDDLIAETKAQLSFARECGLDVQYMDEHMGLSWLHNKNAPQYHFDQALAELCAREGIVWHATRGGQGLSLKDAADPAKLQARLRSCTGTIAFVTHPAYAKGEFAEDQFRFTPDQPGAAAKAREQDLALLLDMSIRDRIEACGYQIARYTDAPAVSPGYALPK